MLLQHIDAADGDASPYDFRRRRLMSAATIEVLYIGCR